MNICFVSYRVQASALLPCTFSCARPPPVFPQCTGTFWAVRAATGHKPSCLRSRGKRREERAEPRSRPGCPRLPPLNITTTAPQHSPQGPGHTLDTGSPGLRAPAPGHWSLVATLTPGCGRPEVSSGQHHQPHRHPGHSHRVWSTPPHTSLWGFW